MKTNVIRAFLNIIQNPNTYMDIKTHGLNRINEEGAALELFVKNAFSNVLHNLTNISTSKKQQIEHEKYFSYLGDDKNSPPDLILKNSDAIEIKKIGTLFGGIALNSSHPRSKIMFNDKRISGTVKSFGKWGIKDILYVIAAIKKNKLENILCIMLLVFPLIIFL